MQAHSASERSVGYVLLMRARVANHYPTHPFRTVSMSTSSTELRLIGFLRSSVQRMLRRVGVLPILSTPLFAFEPVLVLLAVWHDGAVEGLGLPQLLIGHAFGALQVGATKVSTTK